MRRICDYLVKLCLGLTDIGSALFNYSMCCRRCGSLAFHRCGRRLRSGYALIVFLPGDLVFLNQSVVPLQVCLGFRIVRFRLRDSGELENVADSVLGLYREEMHRPDTDQQHVAEVIVLKKRQLGDDVGTTRRFVWVGESYRDYAAHA